MLFFFIVGGVQCEQMLVSCIQIKCIVDFNWGYFVGDFVWIVGLFQIVGVEDLCFFQLVNVICSDLFQW